MNKSAQVIDVNPFIVSENKYQIYSKYQMQFFRKYSIENRDAFLLG
jgi:arginyl-tRNA--protein-N-Asp/Glu arginylyltransferase